MSDIRANIKPERVEHNITQMRIGERFDELTVSVCPKCGRNCLAAPWGHASTRYLHAVNEVVYLGERVSIETPDYCNGAKEGGAE